MAKLEFPGEPAAGSGQLGVSWMMGREMGNEVSNAVTPCSVELVVPCSAGLMEAGKAVARL